MKIIHQIKMWLFGPPCAFLLIVLVSCVNREKKLQKTQEKTQEKTEINNYINSVKESENSTESKATVKILDNDYSFISLNDFSKYVKSNYDKSEEANNFNKTTKIRKYFPNGTISEETEINENLSSVKSAYKEAQEFLEKQKKISFHWQRKYELAKSDFFKEETKNKELLKENTILKNEFSALKKTKDLSVKKEQAYSWQLFFVGLFIGWFFLPSIFRWIKSWLIRFNPYLKLLQYLKTIV